MICSFSGLYTTGSSLSIRRNASQAVRTSASIYACISAFVPTRRNHRAHCFLTLRSLIPSDHSAAAASGKSPKRVQAIVDRLYPQGDSFTPAVTGQRPKARGGAGSAAWCGPCGRGQTSPPGPPPRPRSPRPSPGSPASRNAYATGNGCGEAW